MISGVIIIDKLRVMAIIGCERAERTNEQEVLVDLRIKADLTAAVAADKIEAAIDYEAVANLIKSVIQEGKFRLLEALTSGVLDAVEQRYSPDYLWIRACKPDAIEFASACGVEMERDCR